MGQKISDLPSATEVTGDELIEVVQNGVSKRLPLSLIDATQQIASIAEEVELLAQDKVDVTAYDTKVSELLTAIGGLQDSVIALNQSNESVTDRLSQAEQRLLNVNRLPMVDAVSRSLNDTTPMVTGNVLVSATDPDGDQVFVSSLMFANITRTPGVQFSGMYGNWRIDRDGTYLFTPNGLARALSSGMDVVESVSFTVEDTSGGKRNSTISVNISGTNSAPVANADTSVAPSAASGQSGNVILNDTDDESDPLTIVSYTIDGISGTHNAGQTVTIPAFGDFTLSANGAWTRVRTGAESGIIVVRYKLSDGVNESTGVLSIVLQSGLINISSNPVTTAMTGTRTFNVGPDKEYAEVNDIPWATLQAGDVVNIFHRSTPYVCKFGIAAQGEANARVIINGVTDASGVRPKITGAGATTPVTMMPSTGKQIFNLNSDAVLTEGSGTIILRRAVNEPDPNFKPGHILIQNLDVTGASDEHTYTSLAGNTRNYSFSSGIYGRLVDDVRIENCLIHGNTLGLFTHVNGAGRMYRCERWTIRSNRVYGNGRTGSNTEHGMYLQGLQFVVEFNYIGQNKLGAGGASSKHRVGGDIIRYNWIEAHARALDLVEMEDQIPYNTSDPDEAPNKPYYGIDYVYGNVIINDQNLPGGASYRPIHYGADNAGEQTDGGAAMIPGPTHRKKLYFFNNTFISNINGAAARNFIFQVSARDIVVELWNNVFYLAGEVPLHWTQHAGTLNFRGTNLVYRIGGTLTNAQYDANASNVLINNIGTILQNDPKLLSVSATSRDLSLTDTSPALDVATGIPAGLSHDLTIYPVEFQPRRAANGGTARTVIGAGSDLGAFEFDPLAIPDSAPTNVSAPTVPATALVGSSIDATTGSWLRMAAGTYSFKWQVNIGGVWTDIDGANSQTYVVNVTGDIRVMVTATNIIDSTSVPSDICVASTGAIDAPIIAQSVANQNTYRDVGPGVGVDAAIGSPTTNFLVFYTESKTPPDAGSLVFYGSGLAPYLTHLGTVLCADDKHVSVWVALNVPSTVGSKIEATSFSTNGYASVVTLEIPGNIAVGSLVTDASIPVASSYTSSQVTTTEGALLVAYVGTRLNTNSTFEWSGGFSQIAANNQAIDAPRMHSSVASRVVGVGSYQATVAITGTMDATSVGMVVVPITFVE